MGAAVSTQQVLSQHPLAEYLLGTYCSPHFCIFGKTFLPYFWRKLPYALTRLYHEGARGCTMLHDGAHVRTSVPVWDRQFEQFPYSPYSHQWYVISTTVCTCTSSKLICVHIPRVLGVLPYVDLCSAWYMISEIRAC